MIFPVDSVRWFESTLRLLHRYAVGLRNMDVGRQNVLRMRFDQGTVVTLGSTSSVATPKFLNSETELSLTTE